MNDIVFSEGDFAFIFQKNPFSLSIVSKPESSKGNKQETRSTCEWNKPLAFEEKGNVTHCLLEGISYRVMQTLFFPLHYRILR